MGKYIKETEIAKKLLEAGAEVYIVGGAVRDLILTGKLPEEIDFVTNFTPDRIISLFPKANLVGESFGVVKVDNVDIATFRKDVYSANKMHSKGADSVEFAKTIEEDLSRRDLTINAIAMQLKIDYLNFNLNKYPVIDPYNGLEDLKNHIIRFVGDANERIDEDPCRILRAFRFLGLGNNFKFYPGDIFKLNFNINKVFLVARERIHNELIKMMKMESPQNIFFNQSFQHSFLPRVIPSLHSCIGVEQNKFHCDDVYTHNVLSMQVISKKYPLLRLAALLHDIGKPASRSLDDRGYHFYGHDAIGADMLRNILVDLNFSNQEIDYICDLVYNHMFFLRADSASSYRRLMSKLKIPVRELLRLRAADIKGNRKKDIKEEKVKDILRIVRKIEKDNNAIKIKDLAISGKDLIEIGHQPGYIFNVILKDCLNLIIDNPEHNNKAYLYNYVKQKYRAQLFMPQFDCNFRPRW
jgi:poly(A) polymerase/tRNA nucleotidyltransferase (CCA-adding enzyme)